jgi:3-deoxy-D-manno-octulosonic-acid transferase
MRQVYTILIFFFEIGMQMAAVFNPKARAWVAGRRGLFERLEAAMKNVDRNRNPVVWFHASSLGEFEQGRPVIESLRKTNPQYRILLTFFSPSGYEIRKTYDQADWVFYMPSDVGRKARRWVKIVNPALAIFIKYDFWFNHLYELSRNGTPVVFISAVFRPSQSFFQWYGGWFREHLEKIRWFFLQDESSGLQIDTIGLRCYTITGDTRFDRVYDIAQQRHSFPLIEQFLGSDHLILAGSTWSEDEELLIPFIRSDFPGMKYILAPHDTSLERIQSIEERLGTASIRYSRLTERNVHSARVLIIDSVGILAFLYRYATLAYVGGGFGVSIHNIQEPVTFGKPVFFGPNYHKFREAADLVALQGAFCVSDAAQFTAGVKALLADPARYRSASSVCREYIRKNRGATEKIMEGLVAMKLIVPAQPS